MCVVELLGLSASAHDNPISPMALLISYLFELDRVSIAVWRRGSQICKGTVLSNLYC